MKKFLSGLLASAMVFEMGISPVSAALEKEDTTVKEVLSTKMRMFTVPDLLRFGVLSTSETEDKEGEVNPEDELSDIIESDSNVDVSAQEESDGNDEVSTLSDESVEEDEDGIDGWYTIYGIQDGKIQFDKETGTIISAEETVTMVDIPEVIDDVEVVAIGEYAFLGCNALFFVKIPKSVTSIHSNAFSFVTALSYFEVSSINPTYSSEDNILYNKDKTTLIFCPEGKTGAVTVEDTVTSIEPFAFNACSKHEG